MSAHEWAMLLLAWATVVAVAWLVARGVDAWLDADESDETRAWARFVDALDERREHDR